MSDDDEDERKMNDTTMPPPKPRNRLSAAAAILANGGNGSMPPPAATAGSATSQQGPRRKVPRKGFGLADWNRLVASSRDLALRGGAPLRKIPMEEIRRHNSVHDGWIVLGGKVYFVSPYLAYHPGGETILKKVLGRDATTLFDKYHRWVNIDGLIGKLLIGYVDRRPSSDDEDTPSYLPTSMDDGFVVPQARPPSKR